MTFGETIAALRADMRANKGNTKSRLVLSGFRIASYFAVRKRTNPVVWFLGIIPMVLYRLCVEWLLGVEIPAKTRIGPGLMLWHGQGLVLHPNAVLGEGVTLRHTTTIGPKLIDGVNSAAPRLGNRVDVGAHAVIIGAVSVGDGATVGAGAVVTRDVAPGAVVAGNPARELSRRAE